MRQLPVSLKTNESLGRIQTGINTSQFSLSPTTDIFNESQGHSNWYQYLEFSSVKYTKFAIYK